MNAENAKEFTNALVEKITCEEDAKPYVAMLSESFRQGIMGAAKTMRENRLAGKPHGMSLDLAWFNNRDTHEWGFRWYCDMLGYDETFVRMQVIGMSHTKVRERPKPDTDEELLARTKKLPVNITSTHLREVGLAKRLKRLVALGYITQTGKERGPHALGGVVNTYTNNVSSRSRKKKEQS